MSFGEFIDAFAHAAEDRQIKINAIQWTHTAKFDSLRISGRWAGTYGQGLIEVLTNKVGGNWSPREIRGALDRLELRLSERPLSRTGKVTSKASRVEST